MVFRFRHSEPPASSTGTPGFHPGPSADLSSSASSALPFGARPRELKVRANSRELLKVAIETSDFEVEKLPVRRSTLPGPTAEVGSLGPPSVGFTTASIGAL